MERGRHRDDDRGAPEQGGDPRAVPQSRVLERRGVRRRSDVTAPVPQEREQPDPAGSCADCRTASGAVGPLTVDQLRGRPRTQPCRVGADARAELHHVRTGGGGAPRTSADPAVSVPGRSARGLGQGLPASAVPQRVRRRSSARLAGLHGVSAGASGCRGTGGGCRHRAPRSARRSAARSGARGDRSADGEYPGDGRRLQLSAQHVQPRHSISPSARIGLQAVCVCGGSFQRVHAGVGALESRPGQRARDRVHPTNVTHSNSPDQTRVWLRAALSNRTMPRRRCSSVLAAAAVSRPTPD